MKVHVMQKVKLIAISVCATILALAAPAGAVPVLTFDTYSMGSLQLNVTVGWEFFTNEAITVTHLGFYDHGQNGLFDNHEVGIWDSDGNMLVRGVVTAGIGDPLVDLFRYSEIAPLELAAGESYVVAAYTAGRDLVVGHEGLPTTDAAIDFMGPRSATGDFGLPLGTPRAAPLAVFGPNFQIGNPVPEPATLILLGLGLTGAAVVRRRSKSNKS